MKNVCEFGFVVKTKFDFLSEAKNTKFRGKGRARRENPKNGQAILAIITNIKMKFFQRYKEIGEHDVLEKFKFKFFD